MVLKKQGRLRVEQLEDRAVPSANAVLEWNQLTLQAIGQARINPLVGSRVLTITQLAVYDAVNAIDGTYAPYAFSGQASPGASTEAAVASAAHRTLVEFFPDRRADFDAALEASLATVPDGPAENQGVAVGRAAAQTILALRRHDGADEVVAYTPGTEPGDWQPTPPLFLPALGPQWPFVTPFTMTSGAQFRPPPPPELDSDEYAAALAEVKRLGGNGTTTPTERTAEQTEIARFWGGGAGTSYAFGHWNIIAQGVAEEQDLDLASEARLFALLNLATADALISTWDAKYEYNLWRPVTAIRAGAAAGSPDATWTPLLGTPNFPSYTSAHSTVSGAASAVLTELFGPGYDFTAGSEGLAGVTRTFDSFEAAATEAGRSRIYGGIHFQFDNVAGLEAGVNVGEYVVGGFLQPRADDGDDQARPAAPAPLNDSPHADQVRPLSFGALARRQAAGVDPSALHRIDVRSADPGGLTSRNAAGGVIRLDDNAAGWGWFANATPEEDSEFTRSGDWGEQGRMDLLAVQMHEVGHLLDHDHEGAGLMAETLSAGTRREPGGDAATAQFPDEIFTPLGAEGETPRIGSHPGRGSRR